MREWIATNKDVLSVLIATSSLIISTVALILSRKSASLAAKLKQSGILEELHDKVRPGRNAMKCIWDQWEDGTDKQVESLSETEKEQFIKFYNEDFHNSLDENNLALSDQVHSYLHELHHAWGRVESGEYSQERLMRRLGHGIKMDRHLIRLYLKAHWEDHDQFRIKERNRFWNNVPKIVGAAESWEVP